MRMFGRLDRSPFAFPLACLAALMMLFISETSYHESSSSVDELGRLSAARTTLQGLLRYIVDAESGNRGYLLTGRKEYLEPYSEAINDISRSLTYLEARYAGEPSQQEVVAQLRTLTERKLSEMATTIQLRDEGRDDGWKAIVLSDIGREQMEAIRKVTNQLLDDESRRVAAGRQNIYDTMMLNRIGVTAMTALSLLALFMYLRKTSALDAHLAEQQRSVQAERDRLEREVKSRTAQLIELAQHLQTAREDERNRLARDLHDELGALLTAAKFDVARLKSRLGKVTPEVAERLSHMNETLNSGIALKRRIIEDLRPSSLANLGLVAALDILIREYMERTEIDVRGELSRVELSPSAELMVFRLVQEALTNIAKYARATRVDVTLGSQDGHVLVTVRDDGTGFDPELPRSIGHGLLGMRYRVEAEGGRMTLQSAPGKGVLIEAQLPMQAPAVNADLAERPDSAPEALAERPGPGAVTSSTADAA